MARSASADSSERTSLLKEIAELELELARLSDPARGLHQHARAKEGRETDGKRLSGIAGAQVDEESDLILYVLFLKRLDVLRADKRAATQESDPRRGKHRRRRLWTGCCGGRAYEGLEESQTSGTPARWRPRDGLR